MAFESFTDLARVGLKRTALGSSRIAIKSDFNDGRRAQTTFRFSEDLIEKAGWIPGFDRIEIYIDRSTKTIKLCKVTHGGYKLLGGANSRPHVKFTVARGMPAVTAPAEADDVIVIGGEIMFVLPDEVSISAI